MKKLCSFATIAFLATGCAQPGGPKPATSATPAEAASSGVELRPSVEGTELATVISDSCLIRDTTSGLESPKEIAPLVAAALAAVVPKLVDKGLDLAAAKLKAGAAAQTTSLVGHAEGYFYALKATDLPRAGKPGEKVNTYLVVPNSKVRCLHVLALADGTTDAADAAWGELATTLSQIDQDVNLAALRKNKQLKAFANDSVPVFLAELRILRSPDSTAFRLVPTVLAYRKPLSHDRSNAARTLTITVILSGADRKPFLTDTIAFGEWRPGNAAGGATTTRFGGTWAPVPPAPGSATALAAEFSAMSSEQLKKNLERLDGRDLALPFTAEATLVETLDGKKWMQTIADVLTASKEGLSTAITTELLPDKKAAAEKAALTASLGVRQTLELALIDERAACAAWKKEAPGGESALTRFRALVEARFKANLAAVAAGEAVRFPDPLKESCDAQ